MVSSTDVPALTCAVAPKPGWAMVQREAPPEQSPNGLLVNWDPMQAWTWPVGRVVALGSDTVDASGQPLRAPCELGARVLLSGGSNGRVTDGDGGSYEPVPFECIVGTVDPDAYLVASAPERGR